VSTEKIQPINSVIFQFTAPALECEKFMRTRSRGITSSAIPVPAVINGVIRLPDIICRKAFINSDDLFYRASNLLDRAVVARQMYTTGTAVVSTRSPAQNSPHLSPNFYRGIKKCEIRPRPSTPLVFEPLSLWNEVTHLHQSSEFSAAMMELWSLHIWCSLVHPFWEEEFENLPTPPPEKNS